MSLEPSLKAYAKLKGPNLSYFMQELNLKIGRTKKSSSSSSTFCGISNSKKVSKKQAEISWNPEIFTFQITNLGRNSILVNKSELHTGCSKSLGHKSAIKIGTVCFYFILPERS